MLKISCKRPCSVPGSTLTPSRATRRFAPGSIPSRPTPAWTNSRNAYHVHCLQRHLTPSAQAPSESICLEPFPVPWLAEVTDNPEARDSRRESVSLAFLTVLQLLPPRQRAILLLSDVLDWHASEVAHLFSTSVSAVKSALHRARVTLAQNYHTEKQERTQVSSADRATNELLARYVNAWETDDIDGLVALLKEDAIMSMPPSPSWLWGREAIRAFLTSTAFGSEVQSKWH